VVLGVLALAPVPGAGAQAPETAPPGFFGVVSQAALTPADFERMEGVVGTLRVNFDWGAIEPAQGEADYAGLDAVVEAASEHGIRLLPVLSGRPGWLPLGRSGSPVGTAVGVAAWRRFVAAVAARYGPGGSFWKQSGIAAPPLRLWQIDNEPNFRLYWPHPSPVLYARELRIAAAVLRRQDPGARIALAGLAPVTAGMPTWTFLRRLYRLPGIRHDFDFVALHPYSWNLFQLRYQVQRIRRVMSAAGDKRTPLLVSELGVSSGGPVPSAYDLGPRGQARFLRRSYGLLIAQRHRWRIAGVSWFSWQDVPYVEEHCSFCQRSGLIDAEGRPKLSWGSYRRVVDGARSASLGA
jgi:hypothetical protein